MRRKNPLHTVHCARAAFTLVEVLVVVAIIALLIGILIPALSRSREMSKELACLSNLRQLNIAGAAYAEAHEDVFPMAPCSVVDDHGNPCKDTDPKAYTVSFDSWDYGGKTVSDYWKPGVGYKTIAQRPLNPYAVEDELLDPPNGGRKELPIYRCLSDPGTLQRTWSSPPNYNDPTVTCYDDVGTSYQINVRWWYVALQLDHVPLNAPKINEWRKYKTMFRTANFAAPSRFAWLYDQNMDFVANTQHPHAGDHGGENMACVGYMDGHAKYTYVQQGEPDTVEYTLLIKAPKH